ncbi:YhcN/YlaJ family sporulation lipoprotein [Fictibacillus sp. WQ 8-8]|uniref:YhcN/YlaJ family sporulation lipoprotein n=1 Tax=unclassified Fictibacillus TaxID=2644029 RepID=UPI0007822EFD|nr:MULTISPECIES: YhcN/YlaJ family sporulation lipoprotein [unclassified Fictibacillus]MCQ6265649.1 YhcN/YlaJ family sporulation lipoprotein [Fictibacillus sp. WQ 8-8]
MKTLRIIAVMSSLLLLFACNSNKSAEQTDKTTPKLTKVNQTANNGQKQGPRNSQQVSQHLVELITGIPGVEDATAVVLGRYAVVGIDVDSKLDASRTGTIKYSVAEALKKDPYGANAVVTADPDTVQRLREMGRQIRQGHPIGGIIRELSAIVGRLMPQVPNNMDSRKPSPTETNNSQLSNNEKRNLKNQQQKQEKATKNQQQKLKETH